MKNVNKAAPHYDIEIGGETVRVVCDYRTIFNFEEETGKVISSFFSQPKEISSIYNIIEFIYASIKHLDKKYTKDWVKDNLTPKLVQLFTKEVWAVTLKAAWVEPEDSEKEKKDDSQTEKKSPESPTR